MALTPQNNQAFLREVDDEVRREQMLSVWQRYGRIIVLAVVAALVALGGWLYWNHHRNAQLAAEGERLQAALTDLGAQRFDAAGRSLAPLATSDGPGLRASAQFLQADLLLRKEDLKGAAAKFAAVANDAGMPQPFRDLALVRQTTAEFDSLPPQQVVDRLRALAVPGGAWLGSAGEMTAIAYLRMNRRDLAGRMYAQIAQGNDVPASLRQRASQMASSLGVDATPAAGAPKEDQAR